MRVTHTLTGFAANATVHQGRFLIQGLQPGGPYSISVRKLGFQPVSRQRVMLSLGELREIDLVLNPAAVEIESATIIGRHERPSTSAHAHGGTAFIVGEPLLDALPSLDRDLYDFVKLVPQISSKIGLPNAGFSGGGIGFRFNDFLVNGVSERTLSGNVSTAFAGAKSVPLDAVQEYQVLLAPYDVRYGDFAGALVNTVTKAGTNTLRGSVFAVGRNERLARASAFSEASRYERLQYGFSLGGPIIRNRLHFFVAPEIQAHTYPAPGPYVGQPSTSERQLPVSRADLERFDEIMKRYGLVAGSAGSVTNGNPLRNVFARIDLALPSVNSRASAWHNYSGNEEMLFSRVARDTFSLASAQATRRTRMILNAFQIHTALRRAGGGHNELLLAHHAERGGVLADVQQPIIRVSVPAMSGGRVTLNTGTHETAQGSGSRASSFRIKDNLSIPFAEAHVLTLGIEAEWFRIRRGGILNSYGTWIFASLDELHRGSADRYEVGLDFGSAGLPIFGGQYAAYASDEWKVHRRVSVTAGVRLDRLSLRERPPFHAGVDSLFSRRTDLLPKKRYELAPRLGFIWRTGATEQNVVRGGAGLFVARYPLAWAHAALSAYGSGTGVLRCGRSPGDLGGPPLFETDHRSPPALCANGAGITQTQRGDVNLLQSDLRMMRSLRGSLAYDHRTMRGWRLSGEALVTRSLSDFAFVNLNLHEASGTDRNGRAIYGTISASGIASPRLRSGFSEVIDLTNISGNSSYVFATQAEKSLSQRSTALLSYTFSRVRDAQTPLRVNARGTTAWASARVVSGPHENLAQGTSSNDIPHRVVAAGAYETPRTRWATRIGFYYVGESGRPFTYLASGTLRRGDLNADGTNTNDPIYVPRDALDPAEIRFEGNDAAVLFQQRSLETFIDRTDCLRRQRGRILERNSCREPWSNTTVATLRQAVPVGGRSLEVQADVFNVLNLLNNNWGVRREAAPQLLEHVGQTAEPMSSSQSIFRFDATAPAWTTVPAESAFQLQLALRYRF